jgi:hypothetical protein
MFKTNQRFTNHAIAIASVAERMMNDVRNQSHLPLNLPEPGFPISQRGVSSCTAPFARIRSSPSR